MEIRKWTEEYQVYWHDTDLNGHMSFAALSRYLQDVAWKSAESLNFGFKKVSELNLHWVVVRQRAEMKSLPKWGDQIKLETWPRGMDGLWAYRDYMMKNSEDEILGRITSSWMVIDANTLEGMSPNTSTSWLKVMPSMDCRNTGSSVAHMACALSEVNALVRSCSRIWSVLLGAEVPMVARVPSEFMLLVPVCVP